MFLQLGHMNVLRMIIQSGHIPNLHSTNSGSATSSALTDLKPETAIGLVGVI